jgi:hypothetical protein
MWCFPVSEKSAVKELCTGSPKMLVPLIYVHIIIFFFLLCLLAGSIFVEPVYAIHALSH